MARTPITASRSAAKAVLWDLDGTLADSRDHHWRSWRDTLPAHGVVVTHQQFLESFGQRDDAILTRWLGARAERSLIEAIGDAKEARFRELVLAEGLTPAPGAREWVERLHAAGWRQAIGSSAPRANVEAEVKAMGLHDILATVVAAEDVPAGKPDPAVFLTAAQRLGVIPARAVVVEDAVAGIEAARRAGMKNVGLGIAADVTVRSLDELSPDAFERLIGEEERVKSEE